MPQVRRDFRNGLGVFKSRAIVQNNKGNKQKEKMKFKAKKQGFLKRFAKAYAEGFHQTQNKLWKCCQFQTSTAFKQTKNVGVREFGNIYEAEKFAKKMKEKGFDVKQTYEIAEFSGAVCEKPQAISVVYFSKHRLYLEREPRLIRKSYNYSKTPVCTPRGVFPKDLPVKKRFIGAL